MSKENDFLSKDTDLYRLAKKAKRNTYIKIIVISLLVSIVAFVTLTFISFSVMERNLNKELSIDALWYSIHGANMEVMNTHTNYSLLTATTKTQFMKLVSNIPVPWIEIEKNYNVITRNFAQNTTTGPSGEGDINQERIPMYFNGKRAIEFIHPKVTFNKFDDRNIIKNMDDNKVIELAFSFDKGYKVNEIRELFKENIAWFWVDTYNSSDIKDIDTLSGDDVIGFRYTNNKEDNWGAKTFIATLKKLKENQYDPIYSDLSSNIIENITNNNSKTFSVENLKIIGVVVTGTPSELKKFNHILSIRAASLGVITDNYNIKN